MKPPKERNKQPDVVRKAGPHVKPEKHEPEVCYVCGGTGYLDMSDESCHNCQGTGEV